MRGHLKGENPCTSGSDLHVDKMDGGFQFGGCVMFCGDGEQGQNQWRDFALFQDRKGGRGTAIRVLCGDWICAVCCRYNSKLHGTIFEDVPRTDESSISSQPSTDPSRSSEPPAGPVQGLHIVSYNMKLIETFVNRVGTSSAMEQRNVVDQLDSRLRSIALRELWHMM